MTYKKKYKYRKSLKKKRRGGAALLGKFASAASKGSLPNPLTKGIPSSLSGGIPSALTDALPKGIPSSLTSGMPNQLGNQLQNLEGVPINALTSKMGQLESLKSAIPKGLIPKGKMPKSIYVMIAEFILNQTTKTRLNFSLAKKLISSPSFHENKYAKQIQALNPTEKENFKCACKLIYLYYYDEYAQKYTFLFDNSQEIDNICTIMFIINQQLLLYNSSKKKSLLNFNDIFKNNSAFRNLYNQSINIPNNCDDMKRKIQNLFKKDGNDYSYMILYILFDLLNQTSLFFINVMNELKNNNEQKKCKLSDEQNILETCEEKQTYEHLMSIINPLK